MAGNRKVKAPIVAGAKVIVLGLLVWCGLESACRTLNSHHAEQYALERNPWALADAVLAHIKQTGQPPCSIWECIVLADEQQPRMLEEHGTIWIRLLANRNTVMLPLLARTTLHFPASPDAMSVCDDQLVTGEDGRPFALLSMRGAEERVLRDVNVYLWRNWVLLSSGQKTGQKWLDRYTPAQEEWPSPR